MYLEDFINDLRSYKLITHRRCIVIQDEYGNLYDLKGIEKDKAGEFVILKISKS